MLADDVRSVCGGMTDLSNETLEALCNMALEYAEAYTGRKLRKSHYEESYYVNGTTVLLSGYPVERIEQVCVDGKEIDLERIQVEAENGILTLPVRAGMCDVTYDGGYDVLPGPVICACGMLAMSIAQASANGGQQVTFQALDGYQVTYASKSASGETLEMLSPVAAVMLKPYRSRQGMRVIR